VVPGHWEGDLIIGKGGKPQVIAQGERSTRFLMLPGLNHDRTAERTALVLSSELARLPEELKRSPTWDQGVEMADPACFSVASAVPVYFCAPHSPRRRGTDENANGLVRQHLPKGTDLSWRTRRNSMRSRRGSTCDRGKLSDTALRQKSGTKC
jgi:IS30 family transposase